MKGWIYIISNKAMPGLLKIGYSMKDPNLRAIELGGSGVPYPYSVEYEILIDDPEQAEKKIHKSLEMNRVRKEWFRCSLDEAIKAIKVNLGNKIIYEGINSSNETQGNVISRKYEFCPQCSGSVIQKTIGDVKFIKCQKCGSVFRQ